MISPNGSETSLLEWSSPSLVTGRGKRLAYDVELHWGQRSKRLGREQIFLWSKGNGESKQLTHLKGLFQHVAFSSGWEEDWDSVRGECDAVGGGAGGDEAVVGGDRGGWD